MSKSVEQWRGTVQRELDRQKVPLPVDLVLDLIWVESRGRAGSTNPASGASGLMQVMPGTLDWYNKQHTTKIPLAHLRSSSYGGEQIRVGVWVLAQFWKGAYRYLKDRLDTIPTEQLARVADLFYVAGPGATRKKLDKVEPPFLEAVAARFPNWNALPHPKNVFERFDARGIEWDLDAISKWLHGKVTKEKIAKGVSILALAAVLVIYWYFLREDKKNGKD